MGDKSKIEWTDATWNPLTGCTKVSAGCRNCYAERMAQRFWAKQYSRTVGGQPRPFVDVRCHPEHLEQPLHWRKPRKVFVCSMSDLFHHSVDFEFTDRVWEVMRDCQRHTFQILTKRPKRMQKYIDELGWVAENVWLGVSVEDQKSADERIPLLLQTPAAVRFVSLEPLLSRVDLGEWLFEEDVNPDPDLGSKIRPALDWAIVGGESGPNARPSHPDWFRGVRDQCQAAGAPFFFKQRGEWSWDKGGGGDARPTHYLCQHGTFLPMNPHSKCCEGGCDVYAIARVGKKRAGRLLDGREWNEYPAQQANRRERRGPRN